MLYLREATEADMALVLAWRNNPDVWRGTYSQRESITWREHQKWWGSREDHISFMVVLVVNNISRDVGILNISPLTYWSPEIGIIIGEVSLWGLGVGTKAFKLGCDWLKEKGYQWTSTTVLDSNVAMIKVLKKLGFKRTCEARKDESRYAKELK